MLYMFQNLDLNLDTMLLIQFIHFSLYMQSEDELIVAETCSCD
jgi:hypothetical protein